MTFLKHNFYFHRKSDFFLKLCPSWHFRRRINRFLSLSNLCPPFLLSPFLVHFFPFPYFGLPSHVCWGGAAFTTSIFWCQIFRIQRQNITFSTSKFQVRRQYFNVKYFDVKYFELISKLALNILFLRFSTSKFWHQNLKFDVELIDSPFDVNSTSIFWHQIFWTWNFDIKIFLHFSTLKFQVQHQNQRFAVQRWFYVNILMLSILNKKFWRWKCWIFWHRNAWNISTLKY